MSFWRAFFVAVFLLVAATPAALPYTPQPLLSSSKTGRGTGRTADPIFQFRGGAQWKNRRGLTTDNKDASTTTVTQNKETEKVAAVATTAMASMVPDFKALMAAISGVGAWYSKSLERNPIIMKSCTAGFIFALSDLLAQKIEPPKDGGEKKSLDLSRITGSLLVGLLYFGPAAHYWYEIIFQLLPGSGLGSTLQKAFWGQVIFGPSFTCIFFATSLLQTGTFSLANWWRKIRNDLPGAWLAGIGYWPIVDLISYSVIPVKWIPLFINLCSLVWTVYLSMVSNKPSKVD